MLGKQYELKATVKVDIIESSLDFKKFFSSSIGVDMDARYEQLTVNGSFFKEKIESFKFASNKCYIVGIPSGKSAFHEKDYIKDDDGWNQDRKMEICADVVNGYFTIKVKNYRRSRVKKNGVYIKPRGKSRIFNLLLITAMDLM